ncbi:MAG TPA: hypothetical protein VFR97_10405 [Capillimicrobium sp.]|nr:hypothetical protein [Capillimicrobium sp.]
MDQATSWFHARQSEESRAREEELAPGGTLVQLGKQLAQVAGKEVDDATAGRIGFAVHRTLGVTYGALTAALVRRGVAPLRAGLTTAAAAFLLVDEGTAISQMTDYPVESHLRGVVGHTTLGLATGGLLALANAVDGDRR